MDGCHQIDGLDLDHDAVGHQLGDTVGLNNCTGTTTVNRGTELDWMRFFWDLVDVEGMTFAQLGDVIDAANPHSWNGTDSGSAGATVAQRLYDGMVVHYSTEWSHQAAANGMTR